MMPLRIRKEVNKDLAGGRPEVGNITGTRDSSIVLGDGVSIPAKDFEFIVQKSQKVQSLPSYKFIAKSLLEYYFGNETEKFWSNSTNNPEIKSKLSNLRKIIHEFVLQRTEVSTRRYLEDYCCQKRKYIKQKIERRKNLNICSKCQRSCKSLTHKETHEKTCSRSQRVKSVVKRSRLEDLKLKAKKIKNVEHQARMSYQEGLEVRVIEAKARGVFTKRKFKLNDYVCVYPGKLLSQLKAKSLEREYSEAGKGVSACYMFFFEFKSKKLCFDATEETNEIGRLLNHSKNSANVIPKVMEIDGQPKIVFFASRVIERGEEVVYNYGEKSREAKRHFAWL